MCVQNVMVIHLIAVEIFQSGARDILSWVRLCVFVRLCVHILKTWSKVDLLRNLINTTVQLL